jgi:hypothetical protein
MIVFARTCAAIAATAAKLEKVALVAAYLRELDDADLAPANGFCSKNPWRTGLVPIGKAFSGLTDVEIAER